MGVPGGGREESASKEAHQMKKMVVNGRRAGREVQQLERQVRPETRKRIER
jgi:hypothetical protein